MKPEDLAKRIGEIKIPRPVLDFQIPQVHIPTPAERDSYQSSKELIRRLAATIKIWAAQAPEKTQPAILAVLNNGAAIQVRQLASEGHHGIRIEGMLGDVPCMLLTHQASVQLLCYLEKVEKDEQRHTIGFHP